MTTTGVVFRPDSPPEDLHDVVRAAEDAGIDELWLWEDCFREGGLTTAAAALAWTDRIRVGIGLLPVPLRNPALAAMEIATLARLWPERLVVALGHGVLPWMAQVGEAVESPMTLLREHTLAVRDLLAGERVDADGRYVHLDGVRLDWPPSVPPTLLVGARGPKTIALAGEVADGVLLDSVADAADLREARATVDAGRERSGREGRATVAVFTEVAPEHVVRRVAELAGAGADRVVFQASSERPDPRDLISALS